LKIPKVHVLVGLGVVAVLLLGGVTFASAHGGDASQIHSCVKGGNLRIVGADETCRNNETALDWNQQGAQGVPGPQGPAGPQGVQGPPGTPGTSVGSFSKIVVLHDGEAGWNPDGDLSGNGLMSFTISDADETDTSLVVLSVNNGTDRSDGREAHCWADTRSPAAGLIHVRCDLAPLPGGALTYMLVNP
jgi:hypothetical protein